MKNVLLRFSAVGVATLFLAVLPRALSAQAAPETASSRPASPEDLTQAELLRAYLQLREQLHTTQLAIVNNRVEAEATARAQASAIAEKVESIKSAIESERERQQAERERQQAERERQQAERERQQLEMQRSNRTVLWIAAAFGAMGLLAMMFLPLFQMRAINRIAGLVPLRPPLSSPPPHALLSADAAVPPDQPVSAANHRLMSVIDRMERRIMELEHTAAAPIPVPAKSPAIASAPATLPSANLAAPTMPLDDDLSRRADAANAQATWIAVLMKKAQSLLATNKPLEAVACYDEILRHDTNHSDALIKKGAVLEGLDRFEAAIECYERVIELNGKMTLAYLRKGAACNRLGRYEEAVECFQQALQAEERGPKPAVQK